MSLTPVVSVVVPVYDEIDSLEPLYRELDAALSQRHDEVEFVFVDDGSRDGSLARMREIAAKDPRVRVLALDGNHGQSAALDAGFQAVRGEITVTLDADLQNDPADLPRLLGYLDKADVVVGVRVQRQDNWWRRFGSRVGNAVRNRLTGESITDVGCALRVIRTSYLRRLRFFDGMHRFLPTFLRFEGARVIEVPVAHRPRRYGRSKYGNLGRAWVGIQDVFGVRWLKRRWLRYRVDE